MTGIHCLIFACSLDNFLKTCLERYISSLNLTIASKRAELNVLTIHNILHIFWLVLDHHVYLVDVAS